MAKISTFLLAAVLVSTFAHAQASGRVSQGPGIDFETPSGGGALTCSQPQTIYVPPSVAERARLKVRLVTLLRESLYDDARGVVNIAREKEIKKLAGKLKGDPIGY